MKEIICTQEQVDAILDMYPVPLPEGIHIPLAPDEDSTDYNSSFRESLLRMSGILEYCKCVESGMLPSDEVGRIVDKLREVDGGPLAFFYYQVTLESIWKTMSTMLLLLAAIYKVTIFDGREEVFVNLIIEEEKEAQS